MERERGKSQTDMPARANHHQRAAQFANGANATAHAIELSHPATLIPPDIIAFAPLVVVGWKTSAGADIGDT
jgi:hypothetical protein